MLHENEQKLIMINVIFNLCICLSIYYTKFIFLYYAHRHLLILLDAAPKNSTPKLLCVLCHLFCLTLIFIPRASHFFLSLFSWAPSCSFPIYHFFKNSSSQSFMSLYVSLCVQNISILDCVYHVLANLSVHQTLL